MLLNSVHHCWNNADILSHQDNSLLLQPCIWLLHPSLAFLLLNLFEGEHVNSRVKLLKEAVSFYFKQVICFKLYCLPVLSILSIRIYHKFYMLTILCVWCPVEPCARWVNPRGLRVPAIAGRVREPALLYVRVRVGLAAGRGGAGWTCCGRRMRNSSCG